MTDGGPGREPEAGGEEREFRVTSLELFFDLVFAFTLTQLSALLAGRVSAARALEVLLIFGLLWWMYGAYAWLTNARPPARTPERLLLVTAMAGFLVTGLAIPHGIGGGIAFGLGYLVVVCVHAGLYARVNKNIWRVVPVNLLSALLAIGAGLAGGASAYWLLAVALAVQAGSPLVVRPGGRFEIRPAHFAERHGALIIVAIGESVAAIGIAARGRPVDLRLVVAAIAGLALSAALWWAYFGNGDDELGERAMRAASGERRPGLALAAYFYAHVPMLLGIVFLAAGVRAVTGHGSGRLATALALGLGSAAFVAGTAAFRAVLHTGPVWLRLGGAAFAVVTTAIGLLASIESQLALLTAGLVAMLAIERRTAAQPAVRAGHDGAGQ